MKIQDVCFVELYKEQIINLLVKLDGCTFGEAVLQWFNGYRDFDYKIYKVIQYILKHTKGSCKTLLNRNPKYTWGFHEESWKINCINCWKLSKETISSRAYLKSNI